jgi:hypothetical protein
MPLPLHIQKSVIARVLLLEVLHSHQAEFSEQGDPALWDEVHQRLIVRTRRAITHSFNSESLQDFLRNLVQELRLELPVPGDKEVRKALSQMFEDLEHKVDDFVAVPLDPLISLFEAVLATTASFYASHGVDIHETFHEDVSFNIGFTIDHDPRPFPAIHLVTARTDFHDNGTRPSSVVHLNLVRVESFDWPTALSIPYVLFHECISHVAQGLWSTARLSPGGFSSFADGWMDFIAYQVHAAALESKGLGDFGSDFQQYPARCLSEASKLHDARYEPYGSDKGWSRRFTGRDAAQELLKRIYRVLPETKNNPEIALWSLSSALNVSDVPHIDRDLFAKCIQRAMRRETLRARVTQLLRAYADHRNVHRLVYSVLQLAER